MIFKEMKLYDKGNRKRLVQKLLYDEIDFSSPMVALLGPTPKPYIEIISKELRVEEIFNYEKGNTLNEYRGNTDIKIHNINKDVFYAKPEPIMDLDLMRTVISEDYLLRHLFHEQQKNFIEDKKAFILTLSIRGTTMDNITEFLSNLLQSTISRKKNKMNCQGDYRGIHEYTFFTEKKYQLKAFSYFDTSRMISILIQYR